MGMGSWTRGTWSAALVACCVSLAGAGSAQAAAGLEVAIQDDGVLINRAYSNPYLVLQRAVELGASRVRVNVLWARALGPQAALPAAPAAIAYDWAPYDALASAAAAFGLRLQMTLTGPAPAWATANRRVGVYRPSPAHFAAFTRAAAEHFRGRVDRYTIWNEPNWVGWLAPQRDAARIYRRLYDAGHRAIKTVDPAAKVLIGETAPSARPGKAIAPLRFLRAVTCRTASYRPSRRCRRLIADGYAHHPYALQDRPDARASGRDNVTLGSIGRLTTALTRLARVRALSTPRGRPLGVYLTEYGYFASGKRAIAPAQRAAYLRRSVEIARRARGVRQLTLYQLASPPLGTLWDTSLLTPDGSPTLEFNTLRAAILGPG